MLFKTAKTWKHAYFLILAMSACTGLFADTQPMDSGLHFDTKGTFKIVQFTDIHYKLESPNSKTVLGTISKVLEAEKPDLVILTGDIVTSRPVCEGWAAVVQPMIERKIPWAATLGNHDDEHDLERAEIISQLEAMPYSVVEAGPTDIDGSGNYILRIKNTKGQAAAAIYCLDSLAYAPSPEREDGRWYAWIEPSQIDWYRKSSQELSMENGNEPLPSLAFFHIPLPEYNAAWESKTHPPVGVKNEEVCCPEKNTGLFSAMVEGKDIMGVFVGHDHDNDYAGYLDGICLAYGRATGMDTYGSLDKGARVIVLKKGIREFETWLRTNDGKIHHKVHYPRSFTKTGNRTPTDGRG